MIIKQKEQYKRKRKFKNSTLKSNNNKNSVNLLLKSNKSIKSASLESHSKKKKKKNKPKNNSQNKTTNNKSISFKTVPINVKFCWIMSYLSWLLLLGTGWISIKWLNEEPCQRLYEKKYVRGWTIWTIDAFRNNKDNYEDKYVYNYMPFQMHVALIYIVFILALLITLGGCIVFFIKTAFKPDDHVKNGMIGDFSKFHFFPLLCTSALFIIGECSNIVTIDENFYENLENHNKSMIYAGLAVSILALASFIFIYNKTDLNTQDWWVILLLKKGTYSCFIVLVWYYFCYNIYYVHSVSVDYDDISNIDIEKEIDKGMKWLKGCGLAFSIIFGIGSLVFSFVFKDLVASCMNALIYVGLTVYYFKIDEKSRKSEYLNKNADGIVDIIMIALSIAVFFFLLIKYREQCLKS